MLRGTSTPRRRASLVPAAFGSDHAIAHWSLARLVALELLVVAFGHGAPLRGPAAVERALR